MSIQYFVLVLGAAVVLGTAWWLISPLWRNTRLDEPLPSAPASTRQAPASGAIKDNFETMDAATRERFTRETEAMRDKVMMEKESMPPAAPSSASAPAILAQAPMVARAHNVAGKALLLQVGDQQIVRFEDLETINGPDLRIYLSAGLNAEDFVDIGAIRATHGNVNYAVPPDTDTAKYRHVLIWCRAFGVLFSYASL